MIIAISGKAGAGKDTVGKIIQWLIMEGFSEDRFPFDIDRDYSSFPRNKWRIKKFAGKLKSSIEHKFPNHFNAALWESADDNYRNEYIDFLQMTRRDWLIKEAMLMRDEIHPDYWVNSLLSEYDCMQEECKNSHPICCITNELECAHQNYPNWLITDMRFPNELEEVKAKKGICIRVKRPGIPQIDSVSETALDQHEHEFDYEIINDSDVDNLIMELEGILTDIGLLNAQ